MANIQYGPADVGFVPSAVTVRTLTGLPATTYDASGAEAPPAIDGSGLVTFYAPHGTYRVVLRSADSTDVTTLTITLQDPVEAPTTSGGTPAPPPNGFTLEVALPGELVVTSHLIRPGLRVPRDGLVTAITARVDEAPVGADIVIGLEHWTANDTSGIPVNINTADIAIVTIVDGRNVAYLTGLGVEVAKNDVIRARVEQVGSTTAGSDLLLSIDAV